MANKIELIQQTIKVIPDFPKPGISFKDITPILANPFVMKDAIELMAEAVKETKFDVVVGLESRGFWFGVPLAQRLGLPFVPVRKKGKLPRATAEVEYQLEYGKDFIQIHKEDIKPGANVLIVDDIVATGGTVIATKQLLEKLQAKANHLVVLGCLADLPTGPEKIQKAGINIHYLLKL